MFFTRPGIYFPMALVATAFLVTSPDGVAENLGQLPATKHQMESVKGMQGAKAPDMPAAHAEDLRLLLVGDQEVPAVQTAARGKATIMVGADKTVTGGISTSGIDATAAHIHGAALGMNGPVVITLTKDGPHGWLVPADSTLSDAQYASYKAGELYINVHSAAHSAGEIRAQLVP